MDKLDGSKIAKQGFSNEKDIVHKFMNWEHDNDAQQWLQLMGYSIDRIEYVYATILHGFKTDVQVQVTIKLKKIIDVQNLQIKLVSSVRGFNQIDKRWIDNYQELWNIPANIAKLLKYYTGELRPYRENTRDERRMFLDEFSIEDQNKIVNWFVNNKMLILLDIIKGRGKYSAEWVLVVQKYDGICKWVLKPINIVVNHYSEGDVEITKRGNLKIGKVTVQRKGGDSGRKTANMLQFKINPVDLFYID